MDNTISMDMSIQVAERLRVENGHTQQEMAEYLGISQVVYNQIKSGRTKKISYEIGKKITEFINSGGKIGNDEIVNIPDSSKVRSYNVPVYDVEFSAGFLQQIRDKKPEVLTYISIPEVLGCDFVIRAKGDSMANYINNMDWIGIKKVDDMEVIAYGQAYAIVTKDMQLIKYIRRGSAGTFLLRSENANFEDFEIPIKKVLELYLIKAVLKIKTLI